MSAPPRPPAVAEVPQRRSAAAVVGLAFIFLATAAAADWTITCIDCPHTFLGIGDQGLRIDASGQAHATFAGDAVYYAREQADGWQVEAVAPPPATIYEDTYQPLPALALDGAGAPHLSFLDPTNRTVMYATRRGGAWQVENVATAADGRLITFESAIALDPRGGPHIAYAEHGQLRHAWRDGGSWQSERVDQRGWMEMYFSLQIDAAGTPHVSYFATGGKKAHLKYASKRDGEWQAEFVDRSGFLGEFNSLALDAAGGAHISYLDVTHRRLKYARRTAPYVWSIAEIDDAQWYGGFTSIALAAGNAPRISYTGLDGEARLAQSDGAAWSRQSIEDHVWYTALALDAAGVPLVAYFALPPRELRAARWDGAGWVKRRIAAPAEAGSGVVLALGDRGSAHAVYVERTAGQLKYARLVDGAWQIEVLAAVAAEAAADLALDAAGAPHAAYVSAGGRLHCARRGADGWQMALVDEAAAGSVSLRVDAGGRAHLAYRRGDGALRYAQADGDGGWRGETVAATGGDSALALDVAGGAHIVYRDAGGTLQYARRSDGAWQMETVDRDDAGRRIDLVLDDAGVPHVVYYAGGELRHARRAGDRWTIAKVSDDGDAEASTSLALAAGGHPRVAYRRRGGGLVLASFDGRAWSIAEVAGGNVGASSSLALDIAGLPRIAYTDADLRALQLAVATESAPPSKP